MITRYAAAPLIALGLLGTTIGVSAADANIPEQKPEVSVGYNMGIAASIPYGRLFNLGVNAKVDEWGFSIDSISNLEAIGAGNPHIPGIFGLMLKATATPKEHWGLFVEAGILHEQDHCFGNFFPSIGGGVQYTLDDFVFGVSVSNIACWPALKLSAQYSPMQKNE